MTLPLVSWRVSNAAVLAAVAAAFGCASPMSTANQLDESIRAYHHHLLGGDLDRATAYVSNSAMDGFMALHGNENDPTIIEDFQVVSVRFLPRKTDRDPAKAIVIVGADIRKHDSITIKAVRYRQVWEQSGQRWILADESIAKPRGSGKGGPDGEGTLRTAPEAEPQAD